jgi:glycosyltransferase involved in cell wall biosynthesis
MTRDRLILVIPAYDEARVLPGVLSEIRQATPEFEVVVVDDGSQDDTAAVAERNGATVLRHPFNLGYGAALQTGYKYALQTKAAVLVQMDADGQHDPWQVRDIAAPVVRGEYDLVLGSRFLEPGTYRMTLPQSLGRYLFRILAHLMGLGLTDPTSGFQAMNRKVLYMYAKDFFPTDYPDVDVLLTAHRHALRIGEIPVRMKKGLRASLLHGGMRDIYYVYKMLLAIWSAPDLRERGKRSQPRGEHGEDRESE